MKSEYMIATKTVDKSACKAHHAANNADKLAYQLAPFHGIPKETIKTLHETADSLRKQSRLAMFPEIYGE